MTNKTNYVLTGFRDLTAQERKDLIDEINKDLTKLAEGRLDKSHPQIALGPLPAGCPCCGR